MKRPLHPEHAQRTSAGVPLKRLFPERTQRVAATFELTGVVDYSPLGGRASIPAKKGRGGPPTLGVMRPDGTYPERPCVCCPVTFAPTSPRAASCQTCMDLVPTRLRQFRGRIPSWSASRSLRQVPVRLRITKPAPQRSERAKRGDIRDPKYQAMARRAREVGIGLRGNTPRSQAKPTPDTARSA